MSLFPILRIDINTPMTLLDSKKGQWTTVNSVGGNRAFRRRLLEMGFVSGTPVKIVGQAPMGDPLELELRGSRLSIRKAEAAAVEVAS
jgi:ferrous iron transport protein A